MKLKEKRCETCGRVAITVSEAEYNAMPRTRTFYSFNATRYCTECADFWSKHNREAADRSYRARKKLIEKRLKQRCCLTQEYAERLLEQNRELKMRLEKLGQI